MRTLALMVTAFFLSACGSGRYDYALLTGWPIEQPPIYDGSEDQRAMLAYDQSPWFSGGRLELATDSPVRVR